MSDKLKTKEKVKDTKSSDQTPDGSCCTVPPDGDPGPIKP
jgi:hypothetical protein